MRSNKRTVGLAITCAAWLSTLSLSAQPPRPTAAKPAEPAVVAAHNTVLRELNFEDRQDFDDARRGFIATVPNANDPQRYQFLETETAPDTVNPSLWRQARLNAIHGLFRVADGVYQVRGFALANVTIVEGTGGLILIDPLGSVGAAREALALYFRHRPDKPVVAVVYTHSHGDHYGGVKGVVSDAEVADGRVQVIAPAAFMDAVVAESVMAGIAMGRRARFQFGATLPRNVRGHVDSGLGKSDSYGPPGNSIVPPTTSIVQPIEEHTIAGVRFVFQLAPASEAPAEMHIFLPATRVLNLAENATHTMHNLLPLRGTEVRDANRWAQYLNAALDRFGGETDVIIAQHHWPVWGRARVVRALRHQRDLYKYIHDQSVRLMNHGYAPAEIAETLVLPPALASDWSTRGYYGTLSHNVKAVYQKYLGWYDGNPANLNPLPPVDVARKSVEYMGGSAAVLARARRDFADGQYRWVAQVASQVVFAEPANTDARALAADAFEQMGYAAESATWRNAYLLAAQELRNGSPAVRIASFNPEMLHAMPLAQVFDVLGTHVDGPRAWSTRLVIDWRISDSGEQLVSTLENGALTYLVGKPAAADAIVTLPRAELEAVLLRKKTFADGTARGTVRVEGQAAAPDMLMALMDRFNAAFPVVEPRPQR